MRRSIALVAVLALFNPFSQFLNTSSAGWRLLTTSQHSDEVKEFDGISGAFVGTLISGAGLSKPIGLTLGPDQNLYVASYGNSTVGRYDATSGAFMGTFASGGGLNGPQGLVFGPDSNLYVSSRDSSSVNRYDGSTGAFIDTFVPSGSGGLNQTNSLTFGPDGNLYVTGQLSDGVERYDGTSGAFIDSFVGEGSGGLDAPHLLAFGPEGDLYVSEYIAGGGIKRFDGTTGTYIDTFIPSGSGGLNGPIGFAWGPDGNLYVASHNNSLILRYDSLSGAFIDVFASGGGLTNPAQLIFVPTNVPEPSSLILAAISLVMFLDKPVVDRNAVQTVSRLNRCHHDKKDVVVVDFTNNAAQILKAFAKYRQGTPFVPQEPDQDLCPKLHTDILAVGVFTQKDATDLLALVAGGTDAQIQFQINVLRTSFQAKVTDWESRKAFVYLLARFVKSFHFLTCFFTFPPEIQEFATFAEYVGPQLIKAGTVSELMKQIRATEVIKAAVQYQGVMTSGGPVKPKSGTGKKGAGPPPTKVSVQDMITEIRTRFDITDDEALYIKQVTEEKVADPVIRNTVQAHRQDLPYLEGPYRGQVNEGIQETYDERGRYDELADPKYVDIGGIFDIMAVTVIQTHLSSAA